MSVRSASSYLDIKPSTLRAWINAGIIPASRISHRTSHRVTIRVDRVVLDKLMETRAK